MDAPLFHLAPPHPIKKVPYLLKESFHRSGEGVGSHDYHDTLVVLAVGQDWEWVNIDNCTVSSKDTPLH